MQTPSLRKLGDLNISETVDHSVDRMAAGSTGGCAGVLGEVWKDISGGCVDLNKDPAQHISPKCGVYLEAQN